MNSKSLAKQFLKFRQVEQVNRLVEEQIKDQAFEEDHSFAVQPENEVDENSLRLDQIYGN